MDFYVIIKQTRNMSNLVYDDVKKYHMYVKEAVKMHNSRTHANKFLYHQ